MVNILEKEGHIVKYDLDENGDWDGNESTIFVQGQKGQKDKSLWEFIEDLPQSTHELLRDSVYMVTMHFEERVKSFINNILMSYCVDKNGNPDKPPVEFYSYRVEMQARGMPHIHGVAWLKKDFLENLGINGHILDNPTSAIELADMLINCQLPEEEEFRKIVQEVQTHHHTKSCMETSVVMGFQRCLAKKPL